MCSKCNAEQKTVFHFTPCHLKLSQGRLQACPGLCLLPEIPLQQPRKRLAVTGFVAGHLMHGVVDGVQVQSLCALGQVGLALGGAVAPDGAEDLISLIFYGFWDDLSR